MRFGLLKSLIPWLVEEQLPGTSFARLELRNPLGEIFVLIVGVGLLVTAVVVGFWQSGAWDESAAMVDPGYGVIWGAVFGIPGLVCTFMGIRLRMAESLFSRVAWTVHPDPVRLGEEITVEVEAEPGLTRRVGGVFAILESWQITVEHRTGHGDRSAHQKYRRHRMLAPPCRLDARRGEHWSATFRIPRGKTATYRSQDVQVRWTVGLQVKVPWWPDWRRIREIEVLPGGVE